MNKKEYLLVCLMEELAELQQEVSKVLRFTADDIHPEKDESNLESVCREWSDVTAILELLDEEGLVINHENELIDAKIRKLEQYMEHSRRLGTLDD
jgi:hypothetical protein